MRLRRRRNKPVTGLPGPATSYASGTGAYPATYANAAAGKYPVRYGHGDDERPTRRLGGAR